MKAVKGPRGFSVVGDQDDKAVLRIDIEGVGKN